MSTGVLASELHDRFVELLLRGDRRTATREAVALVDAGMPLADFVLGILAPVQVEVDCRWQRDESTHQDERMSTDIADTLLSVAAARTDVRSPDARLLLCVAEREHHNLPARIIAELLRADGFEVVFLGAVRADGGVPPIMRSLTADALVVSCSLTLNLPEVLPLVRAGHELGLPVLVGGRAFGDDDRRVSRLGADAWAATLGDLRIAAERLQGLDAEALARDTDVDVDGAGELRAVRTPLVRELSDRIAARHARLLPRGLRLSQQLRPDVHNLLLFLEAALLCDASIFADYAVWLRDRLTALGAHPEIMTAMLGTLGERIVVDLPTVVLPLHAADAALAS